MSKVVTFISEHKRELASRLIFVVFITIILEHTFGALESIILAILFTLLISTLLPSISTLFLKDTTKFQKIMAAIKLMLISAMFYGIFCILSIPKSFSVNTDSQPDTTTVNIEDYMGPSLEMCD